MIAAAADVLDAASKGAPGWLLGMFATAWVIRELLPYFKRAAEKRIPSMRPPKESLHDAPTIGEIVRRTERVEARQDELEGVVDELHRLLTRLEVLLDERRESRANTKP